MEKFQFNPEDIARFQQQLFGKDDGSLRQEAEALSEDPLSWLTARFELQVRQLEYLRQMSDNSRQVIGWCLASALLSNI